MADVVDILLRLRGSREFQSMAKQSSKAIGGVGTSAEESGKKARMGWKGVAKWAGGAAVFAGAAKFAKDSVSSLEDLGKSTMALQRSTGLSAETASAWGTILKARGVDSKQFNVGMTKLSKTMVKAAGDSKAFGASFKQLGISQDTVRAGDINSVLLQSADAFSKMTNPAEKAAMAQQLFGKQAQTLLPLMSSGSEGIREQLDMADKYGATLSTKTVGGVKELIAQQREMKIAQEGLRITFGTVLLPAILKVVQAFASLVRIIQPVLRDGTTMKVLMIAVAAAFIAYKVAVIASTIATLGFNAAFLLIPLAIIAVVAGLVILYKKVGWFRDAVNAAFGAIKSAVSAVFGWIKKNWTTLLAGLAGPLGLAAKLVIDHWDEIKRAASAAIDWIMDKLSPLYDFVKKIGDALGGVVGKVTDVVGKVGDVIPFQHGGTMPHTGTALVGERGPELVRLPRGANVFPTPQLQAVGSAPALDGGVPQTVITQVFLDKRQIAEAIGQYVADRRARR